MKLYIAGPMTGVPQFNIPLFNFAAERLRAQGHEIINPAELDSPAMQALALASPDGDLAKLEKETSETWGDVLARDVKVIADGVEGIVVLPKWYLSRGARLEVFVGLLTGKRFFYYLPTERWSLAEDRSTNIVECIREHIQETIRGNMP